MTGLMNGQADGLTVLLTNGWQFDCDRTDSGGYWVGISDDNYAIAADEETMELALENLRWGAQEFLDKRA